MGRPPRVALGELVYHVLNRANGRQSIFTHEADYAAFEEVLAEAAQRVAMRVLAYCVMPNHWHLVLWPHADGDLSRCVGWLTLTHTQRWHAHHHTTGTGHLYQGRFKSFPIQTDEHLLTVCRYVERNPVRAGLVPRAEDWRWGSLWHREQRHAAAQRMLSPWPVDQPEAWVQWVNAPLPHEELQALRRCVNRGQPFGHTAWQAQTAVQLGLASTFRPRGRPRKQPSYGA
ncbi:MAG TPA: transposase [Candidatus Tectomicrobia bacterium]